LATGYVNDKELRAFIPAAKIAHPGSFSVPVFTPTASGGGVKDGGNRSRLLTWINHLSGG